MIERLKRIIDMILYIRIVYCRINYTYIITISRFSTKKWNIEKIPDEWADTMDRYYDN